MNFIKPLNNEQARTHLDSYFSRLQRKHSECPTQIRVISPSSGLDYTFPHGSDDRPYHVASIGKVFTAVLVQILAERGLLSIDDLVSRYLPACQLEGLFVYKQVDHRNEVTIRQLMGHTSGIADYFEGKTLDGTTMMIDVLENTDTHWTPQLLLDYTRERQKAVGAPGDRFYYSDTGYILLGLLIESVTGKTFGQNLIDEFFRPLEMLDTNLMFHTKPLNGSTAAIEPVWLGKKEVSRYESLSCDWAGGGIVSTTRDLLKFNQALREGRLIKPSTLAGMDECPNRFHLGIYYGLGMMEIRFNKFFFLLGHLPKVRGHIGIFSTHLYYDPVHNAHIVINFGSTGRMSESFKSLIEIENTLGRLT